MYVGGVNSPGTIINDLLGVFGFKGGRMGAAIDLMTGNTLGYLENLYDMYAEQGRIFGTGPLQRRMQRMMMMGGPMGMGMFGMPFGMPGPMAMMPHMHPMVHGTYGMGGSQWVDLAPGSSNIPWLSKMFSFGRRMAGQFERALRNNPALRMQFESQIGGRIVSFGFRNDGQMRIQRFGGGFMPNMAMFGPHAMHAFSHMGMMHTASMGMFGHGHPYAANPFNGFMLGGLMNIGHGMFGGMGMGMPGFGMGMGMPGFGMGMGMPGFGMPGGTVGMPYIGKDNFGITGGRGFGSWNPRAMPGVINNSNAQRELYYQIEGQKIMNDPSLTVEDQVTLLLMLIMKKMDDDIKKQAEYVNSIQSQQANRGNGDTGSESGNSSWWSQAMNYMGFQGHNPNGQNNRAATSGAPSIDVETMKLKRMIDKRSQMFDMLRQIIDKYNQTAKSMIDSIGR